MQLDIETLISLLPRGGFIYISGDEQGLTGTGKQAVEEVLAVRQNLVPTEKLGIYRALVCVLLSDVSKALFEKYSPSGTIVGREAFNRHTANLLKEAENRQGLYEPEPEEPAAPPYRRDPDNILQQRYYLLMETACKRITQEKMRRLQEGLNWLMDPDAPPLLITGRIDSRTLDALGHFVFTALPPEESAAFLVELSSEATQQTSMRAMMEKILHAAALATAADMDHKPQALNAAEEPSFEARLLQDILHTRQEFAEGKGDRRVLDIVAVTVAVWSPAAREHAASLAKSFGVQTEEEYSPVLFLLAATLSCGPMRHHFRKVLESPWEPTQEEKQVLVDRAVQALSTLGPVAGKLMESH